MAGTITIKIVTVFIFDEANPGPRHLLKPQFALSDVSQYKASRNYTLQQSSIRTSNSGATILWEKYCGVPTFYQRRCVSFRKLRC